MLQSTVANAASQSSDPGRRRKRYHSEKAQAFLTYGEIALADEAEASSLGEVNGPGTALYGARLQCFNEAVNTVRVRVDCRQIPEFWIELDLSIAQLLAFCKKQQSKEYADYTC